MERQRYNKEQYSKYLKMYYYNYIKSIDDVHNSLLKTYEKENKAFKLLFSFGYICEKHDMETSEIKLFKASQQYFYDKPDNY